MKGHEIILAFGSNTSDSKAKLHQALTQCRKLMTIYKVSPPMETEPVGIISPPFQNQIATGTTDMSLEKLEICIKQMERDLGRQRKHRQTEVPIDIDLLKYDQQVLHEKDWQRDYVKTLISLL